MKFKKKVILVANDSGGAEILSSWIKREKIDYRAILKGPAKKIFKRKLGKVPLITLNDSIKGENWFLTGTGWQTTFEYEVIKKARTNGKRVVTFLDHWGNYRGRFLRNGKYFFPNEIWVGDTHAYKIAKKDLPEVKKIIKVENPYFKDIKEELKSLTKKKLSKKSLQILYLTEPIIKKNFKQDVNKNYKQYSEFDALNFFLKNVRKLSGHKNIKIRIRPHPAEKINKYNFLINKYKNLAIKVSNKNYILKDIAKNHFIVGCNTVALVFALMNGNKVFSSIPPGCGPCKLPYGNINYIKKIV